jgi:hypothetical protein
MSDQTDELLRQILATLEDVAESVANVAAAIEQQSSTFEVEADMHVEKLLRVLGDIRAAVDREPPERPAPAVLNFPTLTSRGGNDDDDPNRSA